MTASSRMACRGAAFWVLLVALGACGSKSPTVSLAPPAKPATHRDYDELRERWTRQGRIIRKLDTPLRLNATLFSPRFISAYVAKRAKMFHLPASKRDALRQDLSARNDKELTIFVAAATIKHRWNDFSHKRSVWHVALVNDKDEQVDPSDIKREQVDATWTALFPYIGRFHEAYTFRFPRQLEDGRPLVRPETSRLLLRVAGPLGETELVWRLR